MRTALLFDIDGTLLYAKGLGRAAFAEAFAQVYGVHADFENVSFVGATDTAIIRTLAATYGVASTPAHEEHFFIELIKRLEPRLAQGPIHVYPGVAELLAELRAAGFVLGVVTGNIRATAWAKLLHAGLAEHFTFGAYACDHPDRNAIASVACARARALGAEPKVLVGDTPKDIQAAWAVGLPCLAVATGWVSAETLAAEGAACVRTDFSDVAATVAALRELCDGHA